MSTVPLSLVDNRGIPSRGFLITGICILLSLSWIIYHSPHALVYDEPYHIGLAKAASEQGWKAALTSDENKSAAGPLYAWLHLFASPLTDLEAPSVRWLNFGCLIAMITCVSLHLHRRDQSIAPAIALLGVPFIWPAVGIALTEVPALLAFTAFVILCLRILKQSANVEESHGTTTRALVSIAAGLALGISVLGRQTYLVCFPCLLIVACVHRHFWKETLVILSTATLTCGWLFVLWKGLVPPSQQMTNSGIRMDHLTLSLAYLAVATLIIDPGWFGGIGWKQCVSAFVLATTVAAIAFRGLDPPAAGLLSKLLPSSSLPTFGTLIRALMLTGGLLWCLQLLREIQLRCQNAPSLLILLLLAALAAAPAKVSHQFSSRYVVGALTLIVVYQGTCQQKFAPNLIVVALGAVVGSGTLLSYLR